MRRQRKEEIKRIAAKHGMNLVKINYKGPSDFEKKKQADAIAFLKKNGLPKWFKGKIDWDSL